MLYKKYHRNYVKQFKNGTKITLGSDYSGKVVNAPFYMFSSVYIGDSNSKHLWVIVLPSGKINKHLHVI